MPTYVREYLDRIGNLAEEMSFNHYSKHLSSEFRGFFSGYEISENERGNHDNESIYKSALESMLISTSPEYIEDLPQIKKEIGVGMSDPFLDASVITGFYRGISRAFGNSCKKEEYGFLGKMTSDKFSKIIMDEPSILDEMKMASEIRDESYQEWVETLEIFREKIFSR